MKLEKNIDKRDFYIEYYKALNGILNLTNLEIRILSEFSKFKSLNTDTYLFDTANRRKIADNLKVSIFNLNNYIRVLKDKKIFIPTNNKELDINPSIYKNLKDNKFKIEIIFNIK